MEKSNWTLNDRIVLSNKNGQCCALHLEQGFVFEFEAAFQEWFENLSAARDSESLIASLKSSPEIAERFLAALAKEDLLTKTASPATGPMPAIGSVGELKFHKTPFQGAPDREWQRELVFATITVVSL